MRWILFGTSSSIALIAAGYSIAGLMSIFAGAPIPIAIMASALELGKLVAASWLHMNWNRAHFLLKSYLISAVIVLMLITSMGIFGFLSKAHVEQTVMVSGNNGIRISNIERKIERQNQIISDAQEVISQLDKSVQVLQNAQRIRGKSGAISVRSSQYEERNKLNETIDDAYSKIDSYQEQLAPLKREQLSIETEVGPVKYISSLIYDESVDDYGKAVRFVILMLVSVFDPLAVILMLVAVSEFERQRKSKKFYDDGNLRVDPKNVVMVDEEPERYVVEDLPPDDEIEEDDFDLPLR